MKPKTITHAFATADVDSICTAATPGSAGNMTINSTLKNNGICTMDVPRHLSITSDGNDTGVTFTITGTNRYGAALTETITGPSSTTVTGVENFATVTQVAISGAGTGSISVGTSSSAQFQWVPVDYRIGVQYSTNANISAGSAFVDIEGTLENPFGASFDERTAVTQDVADGPVRAIRCAVTEIGGSGATVTLHVVVS